MKAKLDDRVYVLEKLSRNQKGGFRPRMMPIRAGTRCRLSKMGIPSTQFFPRLNTITARVGALSEWVAVENGRQSCADLGRIEQPEGRVQLKAPSVGELRWRSSDTHGHPNRSIAKSETFLLKIRQGGRYRLPRRRRGSVGGLEHRWFPREHGRCNRRFGNRLPKAIAMPAGTSVVESF